MANLKTPKPYGITTPAYYKTFNENQDTLYENDKALEHLMEKELDTKQDKISEELALGPFKIKYNATLDSIDFVTDSDA
ncbi:hypothetical protein DH09_08150 [Bacillaceae bacterium JMAK1]|nr:hypothetical protein DH09_08150 [Bacillaceae bacterium JMAK1]